MSNDDDTNCPSRFRGCVVPLPAAAERSDDPDSDIAGDAVDDVDDVDVIPHDHAPQETVWHGISVTRDWLLDGLCLDGVTPMVGYSNTERPSGAVRFVLPFNGEIMTGSDSRNAHRDVQWIKETAERHDWQGHLLTREPRFDGRTFDEAFELVGYRHPDSRLVIGLPRDVDYLLAAGATGDLHRTISELRHPSRPPQQPFD